MHDLSSHSGYRAQIAQQSGVLMALFRFAKSFIRMILLAAEPIMRLLLLGLAGLTVAMALLFRYSCVAPHLPFWGMLGFAAALVVLLLLYHLLLTLLSD